MLAKRLIHGLSLSMDSEEAMINKLKVQKVSHTAVFLEKCVKVHRCDSSSIIKCSLAVGASALSLCRTTNGTDEGFRVIKVSRPFIVSLSLSFLCLAASVWLWIHKQTAQNVHWYERQHWPQQQIQQLYQNPGDCCGPGNQLPDLCITGKREYYCSYLVLHTTKH